MCNWYLSRWLVSSKAYSCIWWVITTDRLVQHVKVGVWLTMTQLYTLIFRPLPLLNTYQQPGNCWVDGSSLAIGRSPSWLEERKLNVAEQLYSYLDVLRSKHATTDDDIVCRSVFFHDNVKRHAGNCPGSVSDLNKSTVSCGNFFTWAFADSALMCTQTEKIIEPGQLHSNFRTWHVSRRQKNSLLKYKQCWWSEFINSVVCINYVKRRKVFCLEHKMLCF